MVFCPSAEIFEQLLDGHLTDADRQTVGEHLRGCAACQTRLDGLSKTAFCAAGEPARAAGRRWRRGWNEPLPP
jgi:anti-sigma factor RsiW